MTSLAELFPDEDYRFHLTLKRAEPREFFRAQDPSGGILAERRKWLAVDRARYAALQRDGEPSLEEFAQACAAWNLGELEHPLSISALGGALEPDVLFLSADAEGAFRLRGGALCFPTGWALEEKMGHPMDFIHGVVPGLNQALGSPIRQFLGKLRPGAGFLRDNWGIAATDELNLHPARNILPPRLPVALDRLWLRVEHQILFALPRTRGIVFGIRIALHRLDRIARDPAARGLRRALASMPPELAAYKRLDGVRAEVIRLFEHP